MNYWDNEIKSLCPLHEDNLIIAGNGMALIFCHPAAEELLLRGLKAE
jgi:hypothetical protein